MNTNPNKPSVKKSIANTLYIFLFNKIGRLLFFPMELNKAISMLHFLYEGLSISSY